MVKTLDQSLKSVIVTGIDEIPEVGSFLGLLVDLLWDADPASDPEAIWTSIKDRAEALVNQKLDQDATDRLTQTLKGMNDAVDKYRSDLENASDASQRYASYTALSLDFLEKVPEFQAANHAIVLLPLFAQVANMHLALLSDGVNHGAESLGLNPGQAAAEHKALRDHIAAYVDYAKKTYKRGREQMAAAGNPWDMADYDRHTVLDVIDYANLWPYIDPDTMRPPGLLLTREIFSRAYGFPWMAEPTDPPQRGYYPSPPVAKVNEIRIGSFGDNNVGIDCVSVHYDGGYSTTWMGREPALVKTLTNLVIDDSVVGFGVSSGGAVVRALCTLKAGESTQGGDTELIPEGHYLSSVQVMSAYSDEDRGTLYNDVVRSIRFGYRYRKDALMPVTN